MTKTLDEQLLDPDPDSLAVEADDDAFYSPDQDGSVVVTEPDIIVVGRSLRKKAIREQQDEYNLPNM